MEWKNFVRWRRSLMTQEGRGTESALHGRGRPVQRLPKFIGGMAAEALERRLLLASFPPSEPIHIPAVHNEGTVRADDVPVYIIFAGGPNATYGFDGGVSRQQILNGVQEIFNSSYLSGLYQYGVTTQAHFGGSYVSGAALPTPFSASDILNVVTDSLTSGNGTLPEADVPGAGSNGFYFVFTPTGFTAQPEADRSVPLGWHKYGPTGEPIFDPDYACFGAISSPVKTADNKSALDLITAAFSHEFVETLSDPQGITYGGLLNPVMIGVNLDYGVSGHHADELCDGVDAISHTAYEGSTAVQSYWDDLTKTYVVPGGVLQRVDSVTASPNSLAAGNTVSLSYSIDQLPLPASAPPVNLLLGASLQPNGGGPAIDLSAATPALTLSLGENTFSRQYTVPAAAALGVYGVITKIWQDTNGDGEIDAGDQLVATRTLSSAITVTPQANPIPPVARLLSPADGGNIAVSTLNSLSQLEVVFTDPSGGGINAGSITDVASEFTLGGPGIGTALISGGAPGLVGNTISTYAYLFTGHFVSGQVTLTFSLGAFRNLAGIGNALFTRTFTVTPDPIKAAITSVTPNVLQPLPVSLKQLITLNGTGFSANSTLTFVSSLGNVFTGRPPTYYSNTGQLQYYVSVGTAEGPWSVTVVNNGVPSDPATFYVSSAMVVAPTISPNGGSYTGSVQVTLATATAGAILRYTTDGSAPTAASALYSGPFTLTSSATVAAKGFKSGISDSAVATAGFTVAAVPTKVGTPVISPGGGTYNPSVQVSITSDTPGAQILYTTSGQDPTMGGALTYTVPFSLTTAATVRAYAIKPGLFDSAVNSVGFQVYNNTTPLLSVDTTNTTVGPNFGQIRIHLRNGGAGTMTYNAFSGVADPWMYAGANGSSSGPLDEQSFYVKFDTNFTGSTRVGHITITSGAGTENAPMTITVTQTAVPDVDLAAGDTFLTDSPDGTVRITSPQVGQQVYIRSTIGSSGPTEGLLSASQFPDRSPTYTIALDGVGFANSTFGTDVPFDWILPGIAWTVTAGSHTIAIAIDVNNTVPESNESNNNGSLTFTAVPTPGIFVSDVSMAEGNSGTNNAIFTVSLSAPSIFATSVDFATGDGSAIAGTDYVLTSGTLNFAPGATVMTVSVPVIGDGVVESDETFQLGLSNATHGTIGTAAATCTILNDDSAPIAVPGGPYIVVEGGAVVLSSTSSLDPDGTISQYQWDFNYDGVTFTTDATGTAPTFSAAGIDGPTARSVALRTVDNDGNVSQVGVAAIAITGAPIMVAIAGNPVAAIVSGTLVNLDFSVTNPNALEMGPLLEAWTISGPAGFVTLTGNGAAASFTPIIPGVYTVNLSGGESAIPDAETGTATATITVNPVAPALSSVVLDDGLNTRQRSMIRSVTYNFSQPVQAPTAGSVTITQTQNLVSTGTSNTLSTGLNNDFSSVLDFAHAVSSNGGKTWTVPFLKSVSGKTQASGSLVDGVYSVTMHASLIKDASNQAVSSGDHVSTFHVLFGDINGTPTTGHFKLTNSDFQKFSATFNLTVGQTGYVPYFHFSGNYSTAAASKISNGDFGQFSNRFSFAGFVYTPTL